MYRDAWEIEQRRERLFDYDLPRHKDRPEFLYWAERYQHRTLGHHVLIQTVDDHFDMSAYDHVGRVLLKSTRSKRVSKKVPGQLSIGDYVTVNNAYCSIGIVKFIDYG